MLAPTNATFFFNPFDEETRRDPYALFARARREHPAWRHEGLPVVSVFRHADCQAILRDPQTWSSVFPTPPGFAPEDVPRSMLVMDPPEHTRLRGLVSLAFTPRRIRQLAPRIEAIAHELLAAALARREVDLVEALTYPLPVVVIAELIGVPVEDRARFKAWSDAIVAPLGTVFFEVAPRVVVDEVRRAVTERRVDVLPIRVRVLGDVGVGRDRRLRHEHHAHLLRRAVPPMPDGGTRERGFDPPFPPRAPPARRVRR